VNCNQLQYIKQSILARRGHRNLLLGSIFWNFNYKCQGPKHLKHMLQIYRKQLFWILIWFISYRHQLDPKFKKNKSMWLLQRRVDLKTRFRGRKKKASRTSERKGDAISATRSKSLQEQANQSIANANLAGILIIANSCPCLIGWVTTNRKENLC